MRLNVCSTCNHFVPDMQQAGKGVGQCRRYPPTMEAVPTPQGLNLIPVMVGVHSQHWCGEWAARPPMREATNQDVEPRTTGPLPPKGDA